MASRERPIAAPYLPWRWDLDENLPGAYAIRALHEGIADSNQQKLALTTIIEGLSGYYDLSYRPDNAHDTSFAEGKRFVGAQLVKLTKLRFDKILKATKVGNQNE